MLNKIKKEDNNAILQRNLKEYINYIEVANKAIILDHEIYYFNLIILFETLNQGNDFEISIQTYVNNKNFSDSS